MIIRVNVGVLVDEHCTRKHWKRYHLTRALSTPLHSRSHLSQLSADLRAVIIARVALVTDGPKTDILSILILAMSSHVHSDADRERRDERRVRSTLRLEATISGIRLESNELKPS